MPTAESVLNDALQLSAEEQEILMMNLGSIFDERRDKSDFASREQRALPELVRRAHDVREGRSDTMDFDEAITTIFADE